MSITIDTISISLVWMNDYRFKMFQRRLSEVRV